MAWMAHLEVMAPEELEERRSVVLEWHTNMPGNLVHVCSRTVASSKHVLLLQNLDGLQFSARPKRRFGWPNRRCGCPMWTYGKPMWNSSKTYMYMLLYKHGVLHKKPSFSSKEVIQFLVLWGGSESLKEGGEKGEGLYYMWWVLLTAELDWCQFV